MPKCGIKGLIAIFIVVAAITGFLVSQPKAGSIQWHINKYRTTQRQISEGTWTLRARNALNRIVGNDQRPPDVSDDQFERLAEHRKALTRLGYLEERELVLSNRTVDSMIKEPQMRLLSSYLEFFDFETRGTNVMVFVATHEDMPSVVETVRRVDVP